MTSFNRPASVSWPDGAVVTRQDVVQGVFSVNNVADLSGTR